MISGGNATRSKRLGFKNPNNILCRFTVPASAPFPVLSAECRPHSAYDAILLHLAFGIIVLPLHLVFLLGQLLILVFQGVEVGQLLKALLF